MDGELTWNETGKSRAVENAHPAAERKKPLRITDCKEK